MKTISVFLNRDSVCMADDVYSHKKIIDVDENIKLKDFIMYFMSLSVERIYNAEGFVSEEITVFPGGCATWVLVIGKKGYDIQKEDQEAHSLAVIAQQWEEPKLLIDNLQIGEIIAKYKSNEFYMNYFRQDDPEDIFIKMIEA